MSSKLKKLLFGTSLTLNKDNMSDIMDHSFIEGLQKSRLQADLFYRICTDRSGNRGYCLC